MTYNVDILRSAQKRLDKVDDPIRRRIIDRIRALADDPRPAGCKKLSGRPAWRLRIGTYRVIYEVHDQKLLVLVVDVGHRREIYR
jgi:mRNA interferase RelE/StbE